VSFLISRANAGTLNGITLEVFESSLGFSSFTVFAVVGGGVDVRVVFFEEEHADSSTTTMDAVINGLHRMDLLIAIVKIQKSCKCRRRYGSCRK